MIVGCVMPTYQQLSFIQDAINSVIDQVDELVIVNDGSTDGTAEFLEATPLHSIQLPENRGTAHAINAGINQMSTEHEWLTWVSSDNIMAPDWVETLLEHATPTTGAIYGGFSREPENQYFFTPYDPELLISRPNCYFGPAFLIRSDIWQYHRGRIAHDYDNWLRVEEACWEKRLDIIGVDRSLCTYIAHKDNATNTRRHEFDGLRWQEEAQKRRA